MKPSQSLPRLAPACLLSALLAACSGSGTEPVASAAGGKGPVDGCSLVTAADLQALYGHPFDPPSQMSAGKPGTSGVGYVSNCTYGATAADGIKTAGVLARQSLDEKEARIAFGQGRAEVERMNHALRPAPEFGPEAYYDADFTQLHLLHGNVWLIVSASAAGGEDAPSIAAKLARTARGRL